jgi:hypothetical protein
MFPHNLPNSPVQNVSLIPRWGTYMDIFQHHSPNLGLIGFPEESEKFFTLASRAWWARSPTDLARSEEQVRQFQPDNRVRDELVRAFCPQWHRAGLQLDCPLDERPDLRRQHDFVRRGMP